MTQIHGTVRALWLGLLTVPSTRPKVSTAASAIWRPSVQPSCTAGRRVPQQGGQAAARWHVLLTVPSTRPKVSAAACVSWGLLRLGSFINRLSSVRSHFETRAYEWPETGLHGWVVANWSLGMREMNGFNVIKTKTSKPRRRVHRRERRVWGKVAILPPHFNHPPEPVLRELVKA